MANIELREGQSPAAKTVHVNDKLTLVFSYSTIVAFEVSGEGWFVSENVWSETTGKHINQETPHGVDRIPHAEFTAKLDDALSRTMRWVRIS